MDRLCCGGGGGSSGPWLVRQISFQGEICFLRSVLHFFHFLPFFTQMTYINIFNSIWQYNKYYVKLLRLVRLLRLLDFEGGTVEALDKGSPPTSVSRVRFPYSPSYVG